MMQSVPDDQIAFALIVSMSASLEWETTTPTPEEIVYDQV